MTDVPHIVDVEDDLEYVRRTADPDLDEELDAIEDRLEAYSERDVADPEGVLEEVENELLALEERTEGSAEERVRAARNRIHIFRSARSSSDDDLVLLEAKTRRADAGSAVERTAEQDSESEFWLTVVNDGPPREFDVQIVFYDEEGEAIERIGGGDVSIDAEAQKTITVLAEVPDDAAFYAARAVEDERSAVPG